MINIAGIAIALIFIGFIVSHKPLLRGDVFLAVINVLLIFFLTIDLLLQRQVNAVLVIAYQTVAFLLFPAFFLYGLSILGDSLRMLWILFVPAGLLVAFMLTDFLAIHGGSAEYAEYIYRYPTAIYHVFFKTQLVLSIAGLIWFLRRLRRYHEQLRDSFSSLTVVELKWLRLVSLVFLVSAVVSLIVFVIYNFNHEWIPLELINQIINSFMVATIFYMSFHGIRLYTLRAFLQSQPTLKSEERESAPARVAPTPVLEDIQVRLRRLMIEEKLYLEPQLQLPQVASRLNVSTNLLSQTINQLEKKNFYELVNHYRIDHFKTLLQNPARSHLSILALGLESGFNSKASMNRVFKEFTGQTPSQFQKMENEGSTPL